MAKDRVRHFGRRAAFWGAVAGVAVLANFGLELVTDRTSSAGLFPGLARFTTFTHRGSA